MLTLVFLLLNNKAIKKQKKISEKRKVLLVLNIRKGFIIGIIGSFLTLIGDFLMGANPACEIVTGVSMLDMFMDAAQNAEFRMAVGGMLGAIGIPLEGVAYYQIYRIISNGKGIWPKIYKAAILAYIGLAGAGVHLACAVIPMLYKWIAVSDPVLAVDVASRYITYFVMPPMILFAVLLFTALTYQTVVIASGRTAFPRKAAFYHMGLGVIAAGILAAVIGNNIVGNAIGTGAISIGHLWMFGMMTLKLPASCLSFLHNEQEENGKHCADRDGNPGSIDQAQRPR